MALTTIDIDEAACQAVMDRYSLTTKGEAVNFALRRAATAALELVEAQRMRGSGWEGDLRTLRSFR